MRGDYGRLLGPQSNCPSGGKVTGLNLVMDVLGDKEKATNLSPRIIPGPNQRPADLMIPGFLIDATFFNPLHMNVLEAACIQLELQL